MELYGSGDRYVRGLCVELVSCVITELWLAIVMGLLPVLCSNGPLAEQAITDLAGCRSAFHELSHTFPAQLRSSVMEWPDAVNRIRGLEQFSHILDVTLCSLDIHVACTWMKRLYRSQKQGRADETTAQKLLDLVRRGSWFSLEQFCAEALVHESFLKVEGQMLQRPWRFGIGKCFKLLLVEKPCQVQQQVFAVGWTGPARHEVWATYKGIGERATNYETYASMKTKTSFNNSRVFSMSFQQTTPPQHPPLAKQEVAKINFPDVISLLDAVFNVVSLLKRFGLLSAQTTRNRFKQLQVALDLDTRRRGCHIPYLSAPWWSHVLPAPENGDYIRRKGHGVSAKLFEIYVQETVVATYQSRLQHRAAPTFKGLLDGTRRSLTLL